MLLSESNNIQVEPVPYSIRRLTGPLTHLSYLRIFLYLCLPNQIRFDKSIDTNTSNKACSLLIHAVVLLTPQPLTTSTITTSTMTTKQVHIVQSPYPKNIHVFRPHPWTTQCFLNNQMCVNLCPVRKILVELWLSAIFMLH